MRVNKSHSGLRMGLLRRSGSATASTLDLSNIGHESLIFIVYCSLISWQIHYLTKVCLQGFYLNNLFTEGQVF